MTPTTMVKHHYQSFLLLVVATVLSLCCIQGCVGHGFFQSYIPNGANVERNGQPWPALGHDTSTNAGAESSLAKNAFGRAFSQAGLEWTTTLCKEDSDGDGFSNGEELGDPECVWAMGGGTPPTRTSDISHPGYADSTPTAAIKNSVAISPAENIVMRNSQLNFSSTSDDDGSSYLFTFTFPLPHGGSSYAAVCLCNWTMSGPVVLCRTSSDGSDVSCEDYTAKYYSLVKHTMQNTSVVGSHVSNGQVTIVAKVGSPGTMGLPQAGQSTSTRRRVEFAVGNVYGTTPMQHNTGSTSVNASFEFGPTQAFSSPFVETSDTTNPSPTETAIQFSPTTDSPAPTNTPSSPPPPSLLPHSTQFEVVSHILFFNAAPNPTNPSTYLLTFSVPLAGAPARFYVAACFCDKVMSGPVVLCSVTSDVKANCSDYDAANFEISQASPSLAQRRNTRLHSLEYDHRRRLLDIVAEVSAETASLPSTRLDNQDAYKKRTDFAFGLRSAETGSPLKHAAGHTGSVVVNYLTGNGEPAPIVDPYRNIINVYCSAGGSVVIWLSVALLRRLVGAKPLRAKTVVLVQCFAVLWILVLLLVMFFVASHALRGKPAAGSRALGHVVILLLGLVWLPINRYSLASITLVHFHLGYERSATFHALLGILVAMISTLHFSGMRTLLGEEASPNGERQVVFVQVAGLVAWALLMVMLHTAVFRHVKCLAVPMYALFRVTHFLYVPFALLVMLHVPMSFFVMLPGVVLKAVDYIVGFIGSRDSGATIHRIEHSGSDDSSSQVLLLEIQVTEKYLSEVRAGQHINLSYSPPEEGFCRRLFSMVGHPFSIAWVDDQQSTITIAMKCSGQFTAKMFQLAKQNELQVGQKISVSLPIGHCWPVLAEGPSAAAAPRLLLVGGGIGITSLLSLLQSARKMLKSVHLVWVVRDETLVSLFLPYLNQCCSASTCTGATTPCCIDVYVTGSTTTTSGTREENNSKSSTHDPNIKIHRLGRRPDIVGVLHGLFLRDEPSSSATIVACGPPQLMRAAASVSRRFDYGFRSEAFSIGGSMNGLVMAAEAVCGGESAAPNDTSAAEMKEVVSYDETVTPQDGSEAVP